MNLNKLFETQQKLDDRIVAEKGLEGVDLLDKKILALQVELGELANEWRGFKFWSKNNKPVTWRYEGQGISRNPLLEEYVDCLHFILSIGNEFGCNDVNPYLVKVSNPIKMISLVFSYITCISTKTNNPHYKLFYFEELLSRFFGLGSSLGFTWDQIEQAYYDKNKINHERQDNGY